MSKRIVNEPGGDEESSLGSDNGGDCASSLGSDGAGEDGSSSLDEDMGGGGGALVCRASSISMIFRAKSSSRVGSLFLPDHFLQCLLMKHLHLMNNEYMGQITYVMNKQRISKNMTRNKSDVHLHTSHPSHPFLRTDDAISL